MLLIKSTSICIMMLSMIILWVSLLLSKKSFSDREKNSSFKCGFEPFSPSRLPFSLMFFLVTVILLVFDVEIAILLPTVLTLPFSTMISWWLPVNMFLMILLIGIPNEWHQGALEWYM